MLTGSAKRRALLYGCAVPVLAALIYGGFVYRQDADVGTLLGSADVQLRLASGIPATDRDGKRVPAREQLLDSAEALLKKAEKAAPQSPIVAEFIGFLASQRGEPLVAAMHYRRARGLPGCDANQRDTLVFNEARMLGAAGDAAGGLKVLREYLDRLDPQYLPQCRIESAQFLHQLGRDDEAGVELGGAMASEEPMAWLQSGLLYQRMGRPADATAALARAADTVPIADYYLARLKLAANDVDSTLRLLERANKACPAEVGRLLREDADVWQVLAEDARFRELTAPTAATPGR